MLLFLPTRTDSNRPPMTLDVTTVVPPAIDDDAVLVERFGAGDKTAFDEIVRRYRGRIFGVALRMMKMEEEALEIVQETFLSAYNKLPEFRGESPLGAWLHKIAVNFALMRLRHRKVVEEAQKPLLELEGQFRPDGHWDTPPSGMWGRRADDLVLDAELRGQLTQAVEGLPETYRAVFLLRDIEGLSYEEIALALETTVPSVKSRLHRARLALREELGRYFEARGV